MTHNGALWALWGVLWGPIILEAPRRDARTNGRRARTATAAAAAARGDCARESSRVGDASSSVVSRAPLDNAHAAHCTR